MKYFKYLLLSAFLLFIPTIVSAKVTFRISCDSSQLAINDTAICTLMANDVPASTPISSFKGTIALEDMTLTSITLSEGWNGTTSGGVIDATHTGATGTFSILTFEVRLDEDAEECGVILLTNPTYNTEEAEDVEQVIDVEKEVENPDTASDLSVMIIIMLGVVIAGGGIFIANRNKRIHKIQTL